MKRVKFSTNKSVDVVCKEIEQMIPCVLGTKPKKEKRDKEIVYYPARRFLGTDDMMDDVSIVIRKVNNSLTNVKLEYSEYFEKECSSFGLNWRVPALRKAYSTLENVLGQMFKQP